MIVINEKELSKIIQERTELHDSQPTPFKSDVLMTPLKDCNGGFVSVDKIEGRTLVNIEPSALADADKIVNKYIGIKSFVEGKAPIYAKYTNLKPNTVYTAIPKSNKDNFLYAVYKTDISGQSSIVKYSNNNVMVFTTPLDLKDTFIQVYIRYNNSINDVECKFMLLEGDWTGKQIPGYEGMQHVGELVTLQAKTDAVVTNKQFVDIEVLNTYDLKVNEYVKWVDVNGATVKDNIKITNVNENTLSLDLGSIFGTGVIKTTEKLIPKIERYKLEILSNNSYSTNVNIKQDESDIRYFISDPIFFMKGKYKVYSTRYNIIGYFSNVSKDIVNINTKIPYEIEIQNDTNIKLNFRNANGRFDFSNLNKLHQLGIYIVKDSEYKENKTEILLPRGLDRFSNIDTNGLVTYGGESIILNGNESGWVLNKLSTQTCRFALNGLKKSVGMTNLLSTFPIRDSVWVDAADEEGICGSKTNETIYIRVLNSKTLITDKDTGEMRLQKLKTWLSNNNIPICYELVDSAKTTENSNKTLIFEGYEGCNLQVNSGPVQPIVSGTYSTNIGEKIATIEDAVAAINKELGGVWKTFLILADKELRMKSISLLTTNTSDDIKNKINEILTIWR